MPSRQGRRLRKSALLLDDSINHPIAAGQRDNHRTDGNSLADKKGILSQLPEDRQYGGGNRKLAYLYPNIEADKR